jgi:hypothetical protein
MAGKFYKVKFIQSTELAGVGYSSVGGPNRDGVYLSVPADALKKSEYAELLAKDGLLEVLGDGEAPDTAGDRVQPEEQDAFKASGMTEEQWLSKLPVERGALVGEYNGRVAAANAAAGESAVKAASKSNQANTELTNEQRVAKEKLEAAVAQEKADAADKAKADKAKADKAAAKKK